ncbi:MAG TPA: cytochrome P450 [Myxococcota bacterium]|jgi:cytochrome P450|nr:cytochrome P450 [Myxococcota bacterium]
MTPLAKTDDELRRDPWVGAPLFDPAQRDDPHPALAKLRELDPVNETPLGFWRLTRYDDVVRVLREVPTGVRKADGSLPGRDRIRFEAGPGEFMLQQDPPNHTRLRKLVSKAFTPRAIERMRPSVQRLVDGLLDTAQDRGGLDVIADLALPVPSTVICEMMGVPLADRPRFTDWTADATHLLAAEFAPQEVLQRGLEGAGQLASYFVALLNERRGSLSDDLLSELLRAEEAGDRLSPMELLSQSIGLLIAGFETTIGLIGNGMLALLRHPRELERLREDPGLVASAVEECLRFDGPILTTLRVLREDTEFGGKTIPRDAIVWAMIGAANRDPAKFPDPTRFDVGRTPNEHLAFGGGVHFCLGAHLARMESQIAIGSLVRRFPKLELALDGPPEYGRSLFRVLARLPVRVAA